MGGPRNKLVPGTLREIERHDIDGDHITCQAILEQGDMIDTKYQGGYTYEGGAFKVRFEGTAGLKAPRAKTFFGESAWNDSRRYMEDGRLQIQRQLEGLPLR